MPQKPSTKVIEASKSKLNPKDVLTAIFAETPELREPALADGIIKEKKE